MKIRAILFDSDGILVDSERLFFQATLEVFQIAGYSISPTQWARWYLSDGKGSREIGQILGIPDEKLDTLLSQRDKLFWGRIDRGAPLFPGVTETLQHLANHFRLAIVTSAVRSHFERVHATTNILHFFETIITPDDYQRVKPDPDPYLAALRKLSLSAEDCLAVEDSPRGAVSAVSAGIRCALIPTFLTDLSLCPESCEKLEDIRDLYRLTSTWT